MRASTQRRCRIWLGPFGIDAITCSSGLSRPSEGPVGVAEVETATLGPRKLLWIVIRDIAVDGKKRLAPSIETPSRAFQSVWSTPLIGHPTEALALGETALAAHDKVLGRDHAWTKDSARITADALDALGRAEEAKAGPEKPKSS